jgi:hypothetical protein
MPTTILISCQLLCTALWQQPTVVMPCCACLFPPLQLLVWDLRKGSSSTQLLNFGGTGLYQHPLVSTTDLSASLAAAAAHLLQDPEAADVAGAAASAAGALGSAAATVRSSGSALPPLAPIDHMLLDPCDPTRLGLVMQVSMCEGGMAQLGLVLPYSKLRAFGHGLKCIRWRAHRMWWRMFMCTGAHLCLSYVCCNDVYAGLLISSCAAAQRPAIPPVPGTSLVPQQAQHAPAAAAAQQRH